MLILLIVFAVVLALVFEIWFILKFTSVLGGFFAFVLGFAGSGIIIGVFSKIIVPKVESILQEKNERKFLNKMLRFGVAEIGIFRKTNSMKFAKKKTFRI